MRLRDLPDRVNDISGQVLDAAIAVHRELGPGLLESAYVTCLEYELNSRGLATQREAPIALAYRELRIPDAYFADLIVEGEVVVEVKAVQALAPIHDAQVLTYLRLLAKPLGILLHFHSVKIIDGGFRRHVLSPLRVSAPPR